MNVFAAHEFHKFYQATNSSQAEKKVALLSLNMGHNKCYECAVWHYSSLQ